MSGSDIRKKNGFYPVVLIAVMFIAVGLLRICLGMFGVQDTALITDVRRQGGERNEAVPNRYTYSVSYTFTTDEGQKTDGFTYRIGSPIYVKPSASRPSTVSIRYFKIIPSVNALESESGLKLGNIIVILVGIFLMKVLIPKKTKKQNQQKKKHKGLQP